MRRLKTSIDKPSSRKLKANRNAFASSVAGKQRFQLVEIVMASTLCFCFGTQGEEISASNCLNQKSHHLGTSMIWKPIVSTQKPVVSPPNYLILVCLSPSLLFIPSYLCKKKHMQQKKVRDFVRKLILQTIGITF